MFFVYLSNGAYRCQVALTLLSRISIERFFTAEQLVNDPVTITY